MYSLATIAIVLMIATIAIMYKIYKDQENARTAQDQRDEAIDVGIGNARKVERALDKIAETVSKGVTAEILNQNNNQSGITNRALYSLNKGPNRITNTFSPSPGMKFDVHGLIKSLTEKNFRTTLLDSVLSTEYLGDKMTIDSEFISYVIEPETGLAGFILVIYQNGKSIIAVIPTSDCDTECQIGLTTDVSELIQNSQVPIKSESGVIRYAKYVYGKLEEAVIAAKALDSKALSTYYGHISARFGVVTKNYPADKVLTTLVKSLNAGQKQRIAIFGSTGTGKTSFAKALMAALPEDISIIVMDQNSIAEAATNPDYFLKMLQRNTNPPILYIDEAHQLTPKVITYLLELLDGLDNHNISLILCANDSPSDFAAKSLDHEALIRVGRMSCVLTLAKLTQGAATFATKQIADANPHLVNTNGPVTGPMTLAEVWNQFVPKIVADSLS